jgi:hypothetical protein
MTKKPIQCLSNSLTHTGEWPHEVFHVATHGTCEFLFL